MFCQRCGGDDRLPSQCILFQNQVPCQQCSKPGHAASMCKGQRAATGQDNRKCGCCGYTGHIRRDCPTGDTVCTVCNLGGHHDYMCYGPHTKKTWADKAAAVAHLPQQSDKPKLLPKGDAGWTFLCTVCDKGVYDPTRTATQCPGCKGKLATGDPIQVVPPTSLLGNVSKRTIATERMLDGIGSDCAAPATQEDKEREDKLTMLRSHLAMMETIGGDDLVTPIATKKKEIKDLGKTLASPAVKLLKDQTDVQYSLAEYEQKQATQRSKLQEDLAKAVEKRAEAVANGRQREKEINEEMRGRLAIAKQVMEAQVAQAEEATKVANQKLQDLAKETADKVALIKLKATPLMQKVATTAAASAGNQAALISVAPGAIVHSNHLTPQMFMDAVLAIPALTAHPELSQLIAQVSIGVVNGQALMVPAPTAQGQSQQEAPMTTQLPRQEVATEGVETVVTQGDDVEPRIDDH